MDPYGEKERTRPFPGSDGQRSQIYKFTHEEVKVLRECANESFYQRCLPLSTVLGGATYWAVKTGITAGHPRFGAVPKISLAVIFGYFVGKYSYHKKCTEKFMALPNSKVGEMLRARRGNVTQPNVDQAMPSISLSPFSGFTESYSDVDPKRDLDYDNRPHLEGLDDSFRPSIDNPILIQEEEMPPEQKHVTTYEELRKKNRDEYEQKKLSHYRETSKLVTPIPQRKPQAEFDSSDSYQAPTGQKNKYGDVWG